VINKAEWTKEPSNVGTKERTKSLTLPLIRNEEAEEACFEVEEDEEDEIVR
jgi:hypothetical protein